MCSVFQAAVVQANQQKKDKKKKKKDKKKKREEGGDVSMETDANTTADMTADSSTLEEPASGKKKKKRKISMCSKLILLTNTSIDIVCMCKRQSYFIPSYKLIPGKYKFISFLIYIRWKIEVAGLGTLGPYS